jgi:ABC-type Na+ efflux pump permease subunit
MLWVTILGVIALLALLGWFTVAPVPSKILAVAQAAYRETVRQPLYWGLIVFFAMMMFFAVFLPFFTLGEDMKMMKDLQLDAILIPALLITVFTASISISEEIEGRTAITLLSKPVSRRQFLLGKYVGILLAGALMMLILTIVMGMFVTMKWDYDSLDRPPDLSEIATMHKALSGVPVLAQPLRYVLLTFAEVQSLAPGVFMNFCQVMILTSLAVALATRLPMVVNVVICLVAFLMGRLTHVLEEQTRGNALVNFVAQVFATALPGLNYYDVAPAIVGEVEVPWFGYVLPAFIHGAIYSSIALIFGLILFEDRDLA